MSASNGTNGRIPHSDRAPTTGQIREQRRRASKLEADLRVQVLEQRLSQSKRVLTENSEIWNTIGGYNEVFDRLRVLDPDFTGSYSTARDRQYGENWPFWRTWQQHARLRWGSRLLVGTSGLAFGMLEGLTSFVVGSGFIYAAQPKKNTEPPAELVAVCQVILDEFVDTNQWGELEQELFQRDRRDGEHFLHYTEQDHGITTVRPLEPEWILDPPNSNRELNSFGIWNESDDLYSIIAYHVCPNGDVSRGMTIPAEDIDHVKVNVDRIVKRGLGDFSFDTYETFKRVSRLLENMTEGGAIQAAIAYIRQHATAPPAQVDDFITQNATYTQQNWATGSNVAVQRFDPGTILDVDAGQSYVVPPFAQNAQAFVEIVQAGLRAAAVKWNAPEWLTSADSSNQNFATALVAEAPFARRCKREQTRYSSHYGRTMRRVLKYAADSGRIRTEGHVWAWEDVRRLIEIKVTPPTVEVRDRLKEAQTATAEVQGGWQSRQGAAAEQGRDWKEIEQQNEEYAERHGQPGQQLQMPGEDPGGMGGLPGAGPDGSPDQGGGLPGQDQQGDEQAGGWDSLESVRDVGVDLALMEAGFTGTITDKIGRKVKYVNGERVAGQQQQPSAASGGGQLSKIPDEHRARIAAKVGDALKASNGSGPDAKAAQETIANFRKVAAQSGMDADKALAEIGSAHGAQGKPQGGKPSQVAPPANQKEILSKVGKEAQHRDLNDAMRELQGVHISQMNIPEQAAQQFDAHGTSTLKGLTDLLNNGVDPKREFFTETLGATEHKLLKDDSSFVVLGHPGQTIKQGGIGGVILDPLHSENIDDFRKAFPNVKFVAAKDAPAALGKVAVPGGRAIRYTEALEDAGIALALLEAGFTGTVKDKLGREYHYVNGERTKAPVEASARDAKQADKKAKRGGRDPYIFERGQEIGAQHYHNMKHLLGEMHRGDYSPEDVLDDARIYHEKAEHAERLNFAGRYKRFEDRMRGAYGDAAMESPEWAEVKEQFKKSRDGALRELDEMRDSVDAVAREWMKPEKQAKKGFLSVKRGDLDSLDHYFNRHHEANQQAVQHIADAVDAFKAKHKLKTTTESTTESADPIPVPTIPQQRSYTCAPACLRACLAREGITKTEEELTALLHSDPENGTPPDALVAGAREVGLDAQARSGMSLGELEQYLADGQPVIVCMQAWGTPAGYAAEESGHWAVAIGAEDGNILFADSELEPLEEGYLARDEFERRWRDRDGTGQEFVHYGIVVRGLATVLVRESVGPHKFSSTQFNLADGGYSRSQGSPVPLIAKMAKAIPDEDLAADGRETVPHVTVKYGLHTADPEDVRALVNQFGPVKIRLGKTSVFPAKEPSAQRGGDQYDVVKIDVESSDLRHLNQRISSLPHTDSHPVYQPHITLAYVKPGLGEKYVGMADVDGMEMSLADLVFSDSDGKTTVVSLLAAMESILLESGFTGTITDSLGRKVHYADGKRVSGQEEPAAPTEARSTLSGLLAHAKELGVTAKDAATRLGQAEWDKIPPERQKVYARLYAAGKAVEHKATVIFRKGKELAIEVAKQRGLSDEHAEKVGRILGLIDLAGSFPAGAAAYGATGSGMAAKAASNVPLASLAFIAGSTATNPFATIRAARAMVKKRHTESLEHEDAAGALLEFLEDACEKTLADEPQPLPAPSSIPDNPAIDALATQVAALLEQNAALTARLTEVEARRKTVKETKIVRDGRGLMDSLIQTTEET